jgi:3-deoxy-7-phosphoheptulonate synthase
MIVVIKPGITELDPVVGVLREQGFDHRLIHSSDRILVEIIGDCAALDGAALEALAAVQMLIPTCSPPPAVVERPTTVREVPLGTVACIGGPAVCVIAGPCSVEGRNQILEIAAAVKEAGAVALRGGAFKPRTNPYSFQGLGEKGLEWLAEAGEQTGLPIVTEVMEPGQVELVARYADVLQIGTRNMHNFNLLSAAGRSGRTVLLKRGWSAALEELLHAAEYIVQEGNEHVVLCERGIRTFERYVRNTLALGIVPAVKARSTMPIIVDPSQGTGVAELVAPMSRAAVACGADGLLIEVHDDPQRAMTDGDQSLDIPQFQSLMGVLPAIAAAVGRTM